MFQFLITLSLMSEPGASATGVFPSAKTPVADAPGSPAPPVVGRPPEYSGAVGGPFVVQWLVEPTAVVAEEPLTLSLRITGPGNLADIPRPALGNMDSFRQFAVDDLDDRFVPGDPPRREFRWRLRTRTAGVTEIPRLKFVYFNPHIVPASRGYQTTYADAVRLTVTARANAAELLPPIAPPMRREPAAPVNLTIVVVAILTPPLMCGLWFLAWRRANPDAARLAEVRRSRAASIALRALDRSDSRVEMVQSAVLGYLRDRVALPALKTTPGEVTTELLSAHPAEIVEGTGNILRRCDAIRFGPQTPEDELLVADAKRVILEWERVA